MTMVSRSIEIPQEYETKIKRLAAISGRSETEIIIQAIQTMTEPIDPVIQALMEQGLVVPRERIVSREEARRTYEAYLNQIGNRHIGLTQAVLEERSQQK